MSDSKLVKLYQKAVRMLALRARSVAEIREKLSGSRHLGGGRPKDDVGHDSRKVKAVDASLIDQVIAKLLSQNLLDDAQFAADYIRYQLSMRPLGERALSFRLHHKGIDTPTIQAAIKGVFQSPEVAIELARRAIRSKKLSSLTPQKQAQKLARFLAGRGFSYATIRVLIDDLHQKE